MDSVARRLKSRSLTASIESMEPRCLMTATSLPDIAMVSATTHDSRSVTVDYNITGADVNAPVHFTVYRSAETTLGPDAVALGGADVQSSGASAGPTLDAAGHAATAQGHHELTLTLPGGLPPDPKQPYVLVVADPNNTIPESNKANNTADFRTYVIGVITHGGLQDQRYAKTNVPWERAMARSLTAEGYDSVIPFNWVGVSNHPGAAAGVAPKLESLVLQAAAQLPQDAAVDLHFIGHSEGAVVNSQVLIRMDEAGLPPNLKAGYIKMTMLDPHAANNGVFGPQYSVGEGPLGWLAKQEIISYQSKAQDPPVIVPPNVQDSEVFFQHTPARLAGTNGGLYNLWGDVPIHGQASYFDLTAKGVSHAGSYSVVRWYRINVVPSLATGGLFVKTDSVSGSQVTTAAETITPSGRESVTYAGTAAPEARVRLLAGLSGSKSLKRIGITRAGADGRWEIQSRPIAPGTYRIAVLAAAPDGPRSRPPTMRPTAWLGRVTVGPVSNAPNITG